MKSGYNSGQVPPRNTSMVDQDQHSGVSERGSCGVVPTAQLSCHQRLRDSCEVHGGLAGSPGQLAGGWRVGSRGPSRGERKGEAVQLLIRPATNPLVTAPSSPSLLELLVILLLVLSQVTFRHAPPSPHRTLLRRCHSSLIHPSLLSNTLSLFHPKLFSSVQPTTSNSTVRLFTSPLCHFPASGASCMPLPRGSHGPQPRVPVSPAARRLHYPVPRVSFRLLQLPIWQLAQMIKLPLITICRIIPRQIFQGIQRESRTKH